MLPFYVLLATSAGDGGRDEEPNRNLYWLQSSHEADKPGDKNPYQESETNQTAQAKRIKNKKSADLGPSGPCPVCQRSFKSSKALQAHIRDHTERCWRAMVPLENWAAHVKSMDPPPVPEEEEGPHEPCPSCERSFTCYNCGASFSSVKALGGHRSSHKGKKGCCRIARERSTFLHGANINNSDNNNDGVEVGAGNNGEGANRGDESKQVSGTLDLNLPPPEMEEDEGEDERHERIN